MILKHNAFTNLTAAHALCGKCMMAAFPAVYPASNPKWSITIVKCLEKLNLSDFAPAAFVLAENLQCKLCTHLSELAYGGLMLMQIRKLFELRNPVPHLLQALSLDQLWDVVPPALGFLRF